MRAALRTPAQRRRRSGRHALRDRLAVGALLAQSGVLLALVSRMAARPLWYNEQWRAWHLSLGETLYHPRGDTNSPIALGFAALTKLSVAVFGNTEVALRLPELVSLPALAVLTYLLARRWLGVVAALLTVSLLLVNRMVLTFSAELAPYTVEAACAVAVLLCWLAVPRRALRYAAMAALAVVATPVVFVLAPLLATDVARAVRARAWSRLAAPLAAGVVALLHVGLYVARQAAQSDADYWHDFFLPHSAGRALSFTVRQVAGYVPRALTGGTSHFPNVPDGEIALATPLRVALVILVAGALLAGVVAGLRDRRLAVLPLALFGALAGQLVASAASAWPFGFTRVNTFLLPLAYVLAAVGVVRAGAVLRRGRAYPGVLVAGVAAFGLVAFVGARQVTTVRREGMRPAFGTAMSRLVVTARARASDGDVVVLIHPMAAKGWDYYMRFRAGGSGPRIPPGRTLVLAATGADAERLAPFLAAHRDARHVYVMVLRGVGRAGLSPAGATLRANGYAQTGLWRDISTGGLREYTR